MTKNIHLLPLDSKTHFPDVEALCSVGTVEVVSKHCTCYIKWLSVCLFSQVLVVLVWSWFWFVLSPTVAEKKLIKEPVLLLVWTLTLCWFSLSMCSVSVLSRDWAGRTDSHHPLFSSLAALHIHVVCWRQFFFPVILSGVFMTLSRDSLSACNSDASGEDALCQSSVGAGEWAMVPASFLQQPDEVEPFLGFLHCGCGVLWVPGTCPFCPVCPLHLSPSDKRRL